MKRISSIQKEAKAAGKQLISYEIFPPKGDLTLEQARAVAAELTQFKPDFMSVTYSAGGSGNSQATSEIAAMIQDDYGVPTMAHLTCYNATRENIAQRIADYRACGISNVLALRGDPVEGTQPKDFQYAKDLIKVLASEGFCVGAAAYPEGHVTCMDDAENIQHLLQKQDAGAAFFITQLFFDNNVYYRFWEQAQAAGINVPIEVGIMPFMSKSQITRMVFTCGSSLPAPVIKLLARYENDEASLRAAGIEYACKQLLDLSDHGVDGLHVYVMNHGDVAAKTTQALREHWA